MISVRSRIRRLSNGEIVYIEAAVKDLRGLDGSVCKQVLRAIEKSSSKSTAKK